MKFEKRILKELQELPDDIMEKVLDATQPWHDSVDYETSIAEQRRQFYDLIKQSTMDNLVCKFLCQKLQISYSKQLKKIVMKDLFNNTTV